MVTIEMETLPTYSSLECLLGWIACSKSVCAPICVVLMSCSYGQNIPIERQIGLMLFNRWPTISPLSVYKRVFFLHCKIPN